MPQTVIWQRIEGAMIFAASLALFWHWNTDTSWWAALLLFFAPDLGFLGYGFGPRVGAAVYNLWHLYGLGAALIALGFFAGTSLATIVGTLWLAHAGFDRMLGYGLKSPEGFGYTHLGRIGKSDI